VAEDRALDVVAGRSDVHAALAFLVAWPAHERAARLACSRIREIDGDRYELLDPAARALEGKHPLAAVLLRRALIEVTLQKGRATRYKHAARHVRIQPASEETASTDNNVKGIYGYARSAYVFAITGNKPPGSKRLSHGDKETATSES
jgi:hypothetical protein